MSQLCCTYVMFLINICTSKNTGEEIWQSTSSTFIPTQTHTAYSGQDYGTIRIGQVMSIEFDFIFNGRTENPRKYQPENFFRIGQSAQYADNCLFQRAAYPSMWLSSGAEGTGGSGHIDIMFNSGASTERKCDRHHYLNDWCLNPPCTTDQQRINIGELHHFTISLFPRQAIINITGGGEGKPDQFCKVWSRKPIPAAELGVVASVWFVSDKFAGTPYNRADATFSNIVIKSNFIPTSLSIVPPIPDPPDTSICIKSTDIPTVQPTETPTVSTTHPSQMPTEMPCPNCSFNVVPHSLSDTSVQSCPNSAHIIHSNNISVIGCSDARQGYYAVNECDVITGFADTIFDESLLNLTTVRRRQLSQIQMSTSMRLIQTCISYAIIGTIPDCVNMNGIFFPLCSNTNTTNLTASDITQLVLDQTFENNVATAAGVDINGQLGILVELINHRKHFKLCLRNIIANKSIVNGMDLQTIANSDGIAIGNLYSDTPIHCGVHGLPCFSFLFPRHCTNESETIVTDETDEFVYRIKSTELVINFDFASLVVILCVIFSVIGVVLSWHWRCLESISVSVPDNPSIV